MVRGRLSVLAVLRRRSTARHGSRGGLSSREANERADAVLAGKLDTGFGRRTLSGPRYPRLVAVAAFALSAVAVWGDAVPLPAVERVCPSIR
jgi:hypothetical protein